MMYKEIANKLKKNTEIMERTFRNNNLEIEGFNVKIDEDGYCSFFLELTGGKLDVAVEIKVNLYDSNGDICDMSTNIVTEGFAGYDSKEIRFSDSSSIQEAVRARVFAVSLSI